MNNGGIAPGTYLALICNPEKWSSRFGEKVDEEREETAAQIIRPVDVV
jgi:hypothetical protein